ncbi:MAG: hypothetical protein NTV86_02540 [Planctomycetota bacterium]|nr:hypothetical protein [Planctomycetota bacterium]
MRRNSLAVVRSIIVTGLAAAVLLAACAVVRAEEWTPAFKIPGADMGLTDAKEMKEKGIAAEAKQDWDSALMYWERVIDRSVSSRAQRLEAYEHIYSFRSKVKPLNTDPAKAKPWPTLVVVFKNLDVPLADGKEHFKAQVNDKDMEDLHLRVGEFCKYVFAFTDGVLKIEPEYLVIEEPLTSLVKGEGQSYACDREAEIKLINKHVKDKTKRYEHMLVYVKYVGEKGLINPPYQADTGGGGPGGASFMELPWFPGSYQIGQPGEVELHEFLHPVNMMFDDVICYPDHISHNPDEGSGDKIYKQPAGEKGIVSMYDYVMRVHYTRLMWSELTQQEPKNPFWGGRNLCDWVVLGPFTAPAGKNALDEAFVDEAALAPAEGAQLAGKTWTHARSLGGVLDLAKVLGDAPDAVAYVATTQRICGKYELGMGSTGNMKAFLNGKLVHTAKGPRDLAFNQDKALVTFKEGYELNLYVFKVQNSAKGWKLQARIAGLDGGMPWGSQHELPGAK